MLSKSMFDFLRRLEIFQRNADILDDSAKYTLMFSQILTRPMKIWPEDVSFISSVILVLMCIVHGFSCLMYLVLKIGDLDTFTKVIGSMETVMQVAGKCIALYCKSNEFATFIKIIRYEFWPSNIMGLKTDHKIRKDARLLLTLVLFTFVTATVFLALSSILPLTKPDRELPYKSWYPFDWTATPVYEILYCFHVYFSLCLDISSVLGYDNLFYSICLNCMAQFRLLCEAIKLVGSGKEDEVIQKLSKIPEVHQEQVRSSLEKGLLVICIRHHQKLIRMSNDINKTFGNGHLVQLLVSATSICTACYRITIENNFNAIAYLVLFYFAHICQLFIYCTVSNELSYWSTRVSIAAYKSFWYKKEYTDVRFCLSVLMMRSQNAISMNAFGLFELNYASFVTVMRLTFSLYTFLTKIAND